MSYLSAPLRFCLLLFPVGAVLLGCVDAAIAEDKLALSFDLPPAQSAPQPLVRYEESLPPIEAEETELASPALMERAILEEAVESTAAPLEIDLPSNDEMAVQFPPNEVALPDTDGEELVYEVGAADIATGGDDAEGIVQNIGALDDWIFEGGSDSLVARTVGSAEGTRRWDGGKTMAYYGHVDPGNGVWNLGTFSYQHEASSPEDADDKQLRRLQRQERQLKEKAAQWEVPLSIEVRLNGLDLANQAPLAALDKGGYIERLAEAYRAGKSGEQAIAWARTQSYFDPDKQAWDAPGLGNNRYSIRRDQERRMAAIDKALRAFDSDYIGNIARLKDIHIDGAVASGNPLSGQSGYVVADMSLSEGEVTFSFPEPEQEMRPIVDDSVSEMTEVAFEDDEVELSPWDETADAIADDTLGLIEREAVSDERAVDYVDDEGRAIASTEFGVELEQTYRFVEDDLPTSESISALEAIPEVEPTADRSVTALTSDDMPTDAEPELSAVVQSEQEPDQTDSAQAVETQAIETQAVETQETPSLERLLKGVLPRGETAPVRDELSLLAPLKPQASEEKASKERVSKEEASSEASVSQKPALLRIEDSIVKPEDDS